MSLPKYGVLVGTFDHFAREPVDNYGKWYHGFVFVDASGETYRCAVDVYQPNGGFQYMLLSLDESLFTPISSLANGYHELARDSMSGAIDYIRSPLINQAEGCLTFMFGWIAKVLGGIDMLPWEPTIWTDNTGDNALNSLQGLVTDSARVYVFGAPFHNTDPVEDGMHDVHMNQGDPPGIHQADDGIWQDGCVVAQNEDGTLRGYFGKFETQSLQTDNNGLPL